MYHKFTRASGIYRVPMREEFDEDISNYFNGDIIFSEYSIIEEENKKYVISLDGLLYDAYDQRSGTPYFTESDVADTSVVNLTKVGLDVFDKPYGNIVYHAAVDERLMMSFIFKRKENGDIWVNVSYLDKDNKWKDGCVIYKNYRNNFANLMINKFKYTTVLTDGMIDREKVDELINTEPEIPIMTYAATKGSKKKSAKKKTTKKKSTTTSTTKTSFSLSKSEQEKYKSSASFKTVSEPAADKISRNSVKAAGRVDLYKNAKALEPKIKINHPEVVQNRYNYPASKKISNSKKKPAYKYDYSTKPLSKTDIDAIHEAEDLTVRTLRKNFDYNRKYYNRFKKAMPDDILTRGFMHIFFTKPDLNLLNSSGTALRGQISKNSFFKYKWMQKQDLVKELVLYSGGDSYFMMTLSNKASSFTLNDTNIKYSDYGKNYQNYSIMLGKGIFESLIGGTFDIKYTDTRDLDILALHHMWIQYISNVYHGVWDPKITYIWKKIIDYASSVDIIVTAEDGETILYWSKYYGVFPINVPFSALSWDSGAVISKPDYTITYAYSWREEWDPASLTEINMNSFKNKVVTQAKYVPMFNNNYGRSGTTWVGSPFVELVKDMSTKGGNYGHGVDFKLRFRPGPILY